jgi:hypothetical protein
VRLVAPRLVAERDEDGGDVLAVPVDGREGRAAALRREAPRRQLERNAVGLDLGAADSTVRRRLLDRQVVDRLAADVLVPAQERTSTEETTKRSIVERR